jgi:AraC family transcriptional regulator
VEAIAMNPAPVSDPAPPRFETIKPTIFGGLVERHNCESPAGIPNQWQRFVPRMATIAGHRGKETYGVVYNFDSEGNFDYMCGVEIVGSQELSAGPTTLAVPE